MFFDYSDGPQNQTFLWLVFIVVYGIPLVWILKRLFRKWRNRNQEISGGKED